jgi:hypothetical protein
MAVPISFGVVCLCFVIAFSSSTFFSALGSFIWAMFTFPINITTTWILVKTGMYTLARRLVSKASALKDQERKSTGLMKANALREKVKFKKMEVIFNGETAPPETVLPDGDSSDAERAQSSRSQSFLFRSPRI